LIKKASILLNLGETNSALSLINSLLLIEGTSPDLYLMKGTAHLVLGDLNEAKDNFAKTLKYSFGTTKKTITTLAMPMNRPTISKKPCPIF
ncbi:MAG TPA: hypothetical protein PKJ43_04510, partial [Prolixibacteraceae bacterium]|nr:hypothetical protein [Prolixibacteraceae bacterium]